MHTVHWTVCQLDHDSAESTYLLTQSDALEAVANQCIVKKRDDRFVFGLQTGSDRLVEDLESGQHSRNARSTV